MVKIGARTLFSEPFRLCWIVIATVACGDVSSSFSEQPLLASSQANSVPLPGDYDGDGFTDWALKGPNGIWYLDLGWNGFGTAASPAPISRWDFAYPGYGGTSAIPAPCDYDGDGKTDFAVLDSSGTWWIDYANDGFGAWNVSYAYGASSTAIPVPADYDGDGSCDPAFKDSSGNWKIDYSSTGFGSWDVSRTGYGDARWIPVPGYYTGNGHCSVTTTQSCSLNSQCPASELCFRKADLAIKTTAGMNGPNGDWLIDYSGNGFGKPCHPIGVCTPPLFDIDYPGYGDTTAVPIPADYDNDGKTDLSVKDNNGNWYVDYSSTGFGSWDVCPFCSTNWSNYGNNSAIGVPGDYDHDLRTDLSVYDTTTGRWYIDYASNGLGSWDTPVAGFNNVGRQLVDTTEPYISSTTVYREGDDVAVAGDLASTQIPLMIGKRYVVDVVVHSGTGSDSAPSIEVNPDLHVQPFLVTSPTGDSYGLIPANSPSTHRRFALTCRRPGSFALGYQLRSAPPYSGGAAFNPDYGIRVACAVQTGKTGLYGTVSQRIHSGGTWPASPSDTSGVYVAGAGLGGITVSAPGVTSAITAADGSWTLPMSSGVTQDLASGWFTPSNATEWTKLLAGTSIGIPTHLYGFQEASGNLADSIGSAPLTITGTGLKYRDWVSGWTRKAIKWSDNLATYFSNGVSSNNTSVALLVIAKMDAAPTANRTAWIQGANVSLTSAPAFQVSAGGTVTGAGNPVMAESVPCCTAADPLRSSGAVRIFILVNSQVLKSVALYSDAETVSPSWANGKFVNYQEWLSPTWANTNGGTFIGGASNTSPAMHVLYAAQWVGSTADITSAQAQSLISRIKYGPTTQVTISCLPPSCIAPSAGLAPTIAVNVPIPNSGTGLELDTPLEESFSTADVTYTTYLDYSHGRSLFHTLRVNPSSSALARAGQSTYTYAPYAPKEECWKKRGFNPNAVLEFDTLLTVARNAANAVAIINGVWWDVCNGYSVGYTYFNSPYPPASPCLTDGMFQTDSCGQNFNYTEGGTTPLNPLNSSGGTTLPMLTIAGTSAQQFSIVQADDNFKETPVGPPRSSPSGWNQTSGYAIWDIAAPYGTSDISYAMQIGAPQLLSSGQVIAAGDFASDNSQGPGPASGTYDYSFARTAIGVSASGVMWLVVADGEGIMGTAGATPNQLGHFFRDVLGVANAMGMDSGISTEMALKGVNGFRRVNTLTIEDATQQTDPFAPSQALMETGVPGQYGYLTWGAVANYLMISH